MAYVKTAAHRAWTDDACQLHPRRVDPVCCFFALRSGADLPLAHARVLDRVSLAPVCTPQAGTSPGAPWRRRKCPPLGAATPARCNPHLGPPASGCPGASAPCLRCPQGAGSASWLAFQARLRTCSLTASSSRKPLTQTRSSSSDVSTRWYKIGPLSL